MKGGVPCLGAMFCRQAKSTVANDAIIVQKQSRGEIPSTAVKDSRFGRGSDTAVTVLGHDVCSDWQHGELHVCVPSDSGTTVRELTPSTKHESRVLEYSCLEAHPYDTNVVNFSSENGLGEAEYEGGDEDDDTIDRNMPQETLECESDHPVSEVASDLTVNHGYPAHTEIGDSDSARYYQNSLSGTYGSNMECPNSFADFEVASGHVSDPGVYHTKELESIGSSPMLPLGIGSEDNRTADKQSLKQVGLIARSETDSVRHPDSLNATSDHQMISLSSENTSAGGGGCVPTSGSPRSEGAYQCNTSHGMFKLGASNLATESQKRRPWWKVFLVSHRNIHLEVNGGVLGSLSEGHVGRISPVNGYMSDVDSRGGRVSPNAFLEVASDSEKEQSNSRISVEGRSHASTHTSQQKVIENLGSAELLKSETKGENSASLLYPSESSPRAPKTSNAAQKWDSFTGKTGLSRVEEWVSSVHTMAPFSVDEQTQIEEVPGSPTAPAASFFGLSRTEPEDRKQVATTVIRVDGAVDNDAEMARMVVRSVNPLSTVAHFSGVGLKVVPSLVMFSSLKTLNLSANNFVRINPGCLPKSLHSLDISRNNIVVIEGLRELTRLRVLNLSFNRISRIGNGLSSCTSLKEVYLAGNKISEVEGLHRLSKLVVLDLSFNKLTTTKSMGQIAANYKSLQSLNLLGNAVHSNLGDEQMRRFVTGICPQLVYLNKQALKSVSSRETLGKELKGSGKTTAKPSKRGSGHQVMSSHRRTYSGGTAGNVKNKPGVKGVVSPAHISQGEGHIRKGYHQSRSVASKELLPKALVRLPLTGDTSSGAQEMAGHSETVRSNGVLFREHNIWSAPLSRGIVQAH